MIGLGGGSLAKFFHRRLAGLRTHVVEYDERVIATARALFHVPADDARLTIEHGDGVEALAPECCDLLVVDGYEDETTPAAMVSQAFFDAAWCALEEPGAFVMNVMDDDKELDRHLQRLERAFGGAVLAFKALRDPNIVVIGLKGAPAAIEWTVLRARADALEKKLTDIKAQLLGCRQYANEWCHTLFIGPHGEQVRGIGVTYPEVKLFDNPVLKAAESKQASQNSASSNYELKTSDTASERTYEWMCSRYDSNNYDTLDFAIAIPKEQAFLILRPSDGVKLRFVGHDTLCVQEAQGRRDSCTKHAVGRARQEFVNVLSPAVLRSWLACFDAKDDHDEIEKLLSTQK